MQNVEMFHNILCGLEVEMSISVTLKINTGLKLPMGHALSELTNVLYLSALVILMLVLIG